MKLTNEQLLLVEQLRPVATARGLTVSPEHYFALPRKWRVDVALLEPPGVLVPGLAIEIDGGLFVRGRHSGGTGQLDDLEKHNALAERGWRVLRYTPKQVRDGSALAQIRRCL